MIDSQLNWSDRSVEPVFKTKYFIAGKKKGRGGKIVSLSVRTFMIDVGSVPHLGFQFYRIPANG